MQYVSEITATNALTLPRSSIMVKHTVALDRKPILLAMKRNTLMYCTKNTVITVVHVDISPAKVKNAFEGLKGSQIILSETHLNIQIYFPW